MTRSEMIEKAVCARDKAQTVTSAAAASVREMTEDDSALASLALGLASWGFQRLPQNLRKSEHSF